MFYEYCLFPLLYLDNITLGIFGIHHTYFANSDNLGIDRLPDHRTAVFEQKSELLFDIFHCESDVAKALHIDVFVGVCLVMVILKNLKGGAGGIASGEYQVNPLDVCILQISQLIQPFSGQIPLRRFGSAVKHLDVEIGEFSPISADYVYM